MPKLNFEYKEDLKYMNTREPIIMTNLKKFPWTHPVRFVFLRTFGGPSAFYSNCRLVLISLFLSSPSWRLNRFDYLCLFSVKPTFLRGPQNVISLSDRTVEFECQVTGDPVPKVTWRRDRGPLPQHRMQILDDYTLR